MSAAATGGHEERIGTRPRRVPARLLRLASDERLVELLRSGSEAAFEALYARHHRGVLSFCRHMLGSVEEAEDAVQHTFLAAYGDLVGSAKEVHLRPWLYAIARNRCLTVLRTRRERVEELAEPATEKLSVEVERRWELRALLGDLAGLPDDQRAALVLAELGDLSHEEIGSALGCPREKVKALVFQARSSLIASREAREASCTDVREQLANLRGGALRRNLLRRHMRECEGCRTFHASLRTQRRELALVLPVTPSLGLKAAVLGGGGGAAAGSVVAKTAIVLAVAGGGTAAVETVREAREQPRTAATAPAPAAPAAVAGAVDADESEPVGAPASVPRGTEQRRQAKPRGRAKRSSRGHPAARFVPPGHAKAKKAKRTKPVPPGQAKPTPPTSARPVVPPGQAKKTEPAKVVPPARAKPEKITRVKVVPPAGVKAKRAKPVISPGQKKDAEPADAVPPGQAKKAE